MVVLQSCCYLVTGHSHHINYSPMREQHPGWTSLNRNLPSESGQSPRLSETRPHRLQRLHSGRLPDIWEHQAQPGHTRTNQAYQRQVGHAPRSAGRHMLVNQPPQFAQMPQSFQTPQYVKTPQQVQTPMNQQYQQNSVGILTAVDHQTQSAQTRSGQIPRTAGRQTILNATPQSAQTPMNQVYHRQSGVIPNYQTLPIITPQSTDTTGSQGNQRQPGGIIRTAEYQKASKQGHQSMKTPMNQVYQGQPVGIAGTGEHQTRSTPEAQHHEVYHYQPHSRPMPRTRESITAKKHPGSAHTLMETGRSKQAGQTSSSTDSTLFEMLRNVQMVHRYLQMLYDAPTNRLNDLSTLPTSQGASNILTQRNSRGRGNFVSQVPNSLAQQQQSGGSAVVNQGEFETPEGGYSQAMQSRGQQAIGSNRVVQTALGIPLQNQRHSRLHNRPGRGGEGGGAGRLLDTNQALNVKAQTRRVGGSSTVASQGEYETPELQHPMLANRHTTKVRQANPASAWKQASSLRGEVEAPEAMEGQGVGRRRSSYQTYSYQSPVPAATQIYV